MIPLVQRLRLQAEDLHLLAPASETVKCLSLAADTLEKQSAALKLAREALETIRNRFNWADYNGSMEWNIRNEAKKALAAINEVLGE